MNISQTPPGIFVTVFWLMTCLVVLARGVQHRQWHPQGKAGIKKFNKHNYEVVFRSLGNKNQDYDDGHAHEEDEEEEEEGYAQAGEGNVYVKFIGLPLSSPHMDGKRFYLRNDSLIVNATLNRDLTERNNTLGEVTIFNNSWSHNAKYDFNYTNETAMWNIEIPRKVLSYSVTDWLPKEQWKVEVLIDLITEVYIGDAHVLDLDTEPLLQWELGEESGEISVGHAADSAQVVSQSVFVSTTPCAPDVAVIAFMEAGESYVAVTYDGFSTNPLKKFRIPFEQICPGCDVTLLDVRLTNHRVFLVTDQGLYMSEDLRNSSTTDSMLSYSRVVDPGCRLAEAKMKFTAICQHRQARIFRGDLVTFTYSCDGSSHVMQYSIDDFSVWETVTLPGNKEVLCAAYHMHMNAITFLVKQGDTTAVYTYRFMDGKLLRKARFPPYVFPAASEIKSLHYHPIFHTLHAVGKEIYMSDDAGNSFQLVLRLGAKRVTQVFLSYDLILMKCDNGEMLYGKTGLLRMLQFGIEMEKHLGAIKNYYLHVDVLDTVKALVLQQDGTLNTVEIELNKIIEENRVTSERAFAYQLLRADEAMLYEYAANDDVSFFSNASIGQEIQHQDETVGIIKKIREPHNGNFLSVLHIAIKDHATGTRMNLSRENSIHVVDIDSTVTMATLVLEPGVEEWWEPDDLHKTIVIPTLSNFFLTAFINRTHFRGTAVIALEIHHYDRVIPPYEWMMVDFKQGQWHLQEAKCRYGLQVAEQLVHNNVFVLDVGDTINLTTTTILHEADHEPKAGFNKPNHLATLTNPWQFSISSVNSFTTTNISFHAQVTCNVNREGVTALRISLPTTSHRCNTSAIVFTLYAGCPCGKKLKFHYPVEISREDFLYGNPTHDGVKLLYELEPNYRPPSELGIAIPTNDHIYNADPTIERKGHFSISKNVFQNSGSYKQCEGASSKKDCNCTEDMEYSAFTTFSDCRRKVFQMLFPGEPKLNLTLDHPMRESVALQSHHIITLVEVNDRFALIESTVTPGSMLENILGNKDLPFENLTLYDPTTVKIMLNGSGLYHFRATLIPGFSFCDLSEEFQIYIYGPPLAYPINYVLNFIVSVFFCGGLFGIYWWYLTHVHYHRIRTAGSQCRNLDQMIDAQGFFPKGQRRKTKKLEKEEEIIVSEHHSDIENEHDFVHSHHIMHHDDHDHDHDHDEDHEGAVVTMLHHSDHMM